MSSKKGRRASWSLAARLTLWYTVASFAFTLAVLGILYWGLAATDAVHRSLTDNEDLALANRIRAVRTILRERPDDILALRRAVEPEPAVPREQPLVYVRLLDERGRQRLSTPGMDSLLPPALFTEVVPREIEPRHGIDIRTQGGQRFRKLAAASTVAASGDVTWVVQVAVERDTHKLLLARYRHGLIAILAFTAIACPFVAHRIARRGLRPVHEIGETARHIGSATLSARIESAGYPVELSALVDAFNAMLDRLDESFRRLSQFSADIAHELRTPIHNMRGEAEVVLSRLRSSDEYREALTSCLEESVRLSDLIERLLFLARADSPGTHLQREEVDVARELATVRDYYAAAAAESRVTLTVAAPDGVRVAVDRGLLQRAIGNLVGNSLAHTASGGTITLVAGRKDGGVRIEVRDTGAGIPPEDLPRVFDRFYRADRSRSSQPGSMGLGLAIVKGIVTAHGGQAEIESEVGRGTSVTLIIPTACGPGGSEPASPNVTKT